jgi:hypothetical protein
VFKIQRTPRALSDVLSIFGGLTPRELAEEVRGTVDLLQFYARSQQQVQNASNAALAAPGFLTLTVPLSQTWVLFAASMRVTTPAGATDIKAAISVQGVTVAWEDFVPIVPGEFHIVPFVAPYPLILLPGSQLSGVLIALSGAANANCAFDALVGVLG